MVLRAREESELTIHVECTLSKKLQPKKKKVDYT